MASSGAFSDWIGTYRLVVSPELLRFIETAFVSTARVEQRQAVRAEALAEAQSAVLDIDGSGMLRSLAHGKELYARQLPSGREGARELHFEKAPGHPVTLLRLDAQRLLALQPGKPPAEFLRVT